MTAARPSYSELLRDPRWQRRRLEIMERADFTCETCGDAKTTLNVHHKLYRKGAMPWEYTDTELACVCEPCHEAEHQVRQGLAAAMAELDVPGLEQLLGYAEGILAHEHAFPDGALLVPKSWPLRSADHAVGFLASLWQKVHPVQVDIALGHSPLERGDIYALCTRGPEMIATVRKPKA